jgi:hypothetical protein
MLQDLLAYVFFYFKSNSTADFASLLQTSARLTLAFLMFPVICLNCCENEKDCSILFVSNSFRVFVDRYLGDGKPV